MKRIIVISMVLTVFLFLCTGCGKSAEAQEVEELINSIGEVSIDCYDKIQSARNGYTVLTEDQKMEVENLTLLTDAESKIEELVDQIKGDANLAMVYREPEKAIAMLKEILHIDPSVQETIDIMYDWCFEINGVLIIKPRLLYTGAELVGITRHEFGHDLDSYQYSLTEKSQFNDYVQYIAKKFILDESKTLINKNQTYAKYVFNDPVTGLMAIQLEFLKYNGQNILFFTVQPTDQLLDK